MSSSADVDIFPDTKPLSDTYSPEIARQSENIFVELDNNPVRDLVRHPSPQPLFVPFLTRLLLLYPVTLKGMQSRFLESVHVYLKNMTLIQRSK